MQPSRTILLVDDDQAFRASLRRLLRQAGHRIEEAGDGIEAIKLLAERAVDVVVTDLLMPNCDGLETIRQIRRRWPDLKVIAVSGGGYLGRALYIKLSLQMGAAHALEKPFSCEELLAAMEVALGPDKTNSAVAAHSSGATSVGSN